jgi:hypothetical protein
MTSTEAAVLERVLREARPDVVRWMLTVARDMAFVTDPAFVDYCAAWYAKLPSRADVPRLELDRALGAIARMLRALGYRREARQLAAIVRRSR